MKIKSVSIENFKGIKEFEFNLSGNVTKISGKNATGKTTIADAIAWAITGKDRNSKTFDNIKPILNGEVQNENTTVTVELFDGNTISRTNSNGKNSVLFDGEPIKGSELETKLISEVGSEDVMSILYNPQVFFEMPQKQQLKTVSMLLPSKVEIVNSISKLTGFDEKEVRSLIQKNGKVISADIKKLTNESEQLKNSIKDLGGQIDNLPGTHDTAVSKMSEFEKNREELVKQYGSNSIVPKLNSELIVLKDKFLSLKDQHNDEVQKATGAINDELNELNSKLNDLNIKINSASNDVLIKQGTIEQLKSSIEATRSDYNSKVEYGKAGNFKFCETCGQELPADQLSNIKDKLLKEIHELRSKYNDMVSKSKEAQSAIEDDQKNIESYKLESKELTTSIGLKNAERKENYVPYSDEYVSTKQAIEDKQNEIKQATVEEKPVTDEIDANIKNMQSIISNYESLEKMLKSSKEQYAEIKENILENEELLSKTIKVENAYREVSESSISDLIDEKVDLFKKLKNGSVREDFKVLDDNGVESSQQNNANQIRLGVKIADKIKDKLEIDWPTIVDNAEAVNGEIETEHQLIELIVTDGKLTIKE